MPEPGASTESSSAIKAGVDPSVVDDRIVDRRGAAPEVATAEAFVNGAADPSERPVSGIPPAPLNRGSLSDGSLSDGSLSDGSLSDGSLSDGSLSDGSLSDGSRNYGSLKHGPEGYREITLYLPDQLARELFQYCLEHNLEMSRLLARAVQQYFEGGRVLEQGVSAAARLLLGELARWARTLLGGQLLGGQGRLGAQKRRGESVSSSASAAAG